MTTLLIQNCNILQIAPDAPQANILHGYDIFVRDNRIEALRPNAADEAAGINPDDFDDIIDAHGMLAMPGLINTHAHVPMVIFRGLAEDVSIERWFNDYMWPLENNLQAEDVYWGMMLGLAEMIEAGVTSVADHYFYMDQAAQAVQVAGTRALLGWAIFGSGGQAAIDQTADFIQRWQNGADGRIRAWMAPHAPYTCDDDFLRASAKKARELGVGIHIHVSETMGQTRASLDKRGITPIQVLEQTGIFDANSASLLAHVCGALPEDIDILAKYPVGIAHAPKTYLKLAMGFAPVTEFRAAGIPVGLATDGAVSNNTMNLWEPLRLMAMTQKERAGTPEVMTIPEALYIATRESARVIGMGDQLGAIEPGYLADIILLDLHGAHHQPLHSITASLVYNMQPNDVHTVIVDGRVIYRARQHLTLDLTEVAQQVSASMTRLSQRVPNKRIQVYNP
ncbi:MAG: amidohydrolase [Burkholderiales bacterium]|nr:amidohydrolase [Anaerolineae bacterium]